MLIKILATTFSACRIREARDNIWADAYERLLSIGGCVCNDVAPKALLWAMRKIDNMGCRRAARRLTAILGRVIGGDACHSWISCLNRPKNARAKGFLRDNRVDVYVTIVATNAVVAFFIERFPTLNATALLVCINDIFWDDFCSLERVDVN